MQVNGHTRILGVLAIGTAATLAFGTGEARTADATPTFSSGVEMVNLTVTVTDGRNQLVSGLTPADFQIIEDGVPQQLTVFSRERLPLSLAILMDTSSSMEGRMSTAQAAALRLLRGLREGDEVQVIQFNQRAAVVQPFTRNVTEAEQAIQSGRPQGATALFTALYIALKDLAARRDPAVDRRQAVVVLSDGDDTASSVTDAQVMELAQKANITIYGISLTPRETMRSFDLRAKKGAFFLPELSRATGGATHFPAAVTQLDGIYDRIAEELRTQYNLGYVSTNGARNGAWRKVAIRTPQVSSLQLRYKPGYFAER